MNLTPELFLTIVVNLVVIGVSFGIQKSRIDSLFNDRKNCMERFKNIEDTSGKVSEGIWKEMRDISAKLNQFMGMFNMFMSQNSKGEKQ